MLVANTDPESMSGQHWVYFFIKRLKDCIKCYDSYGKGIQYW